ncbi:MAG: hypothetical protein ABL866_10555 [Devosia sp.]
MRKAELDRLLLNAVAHAIGQPPPQRLRARRKAAAKSPRAYPPLTRSGADHHHIQA